MPLTPEEIAALLQREGSGLSPDDYDETTESEETKKRRTGLLSDVHVACRQALYSNTGDMELIAEKLGDGSRDVAWRIPYGESGILGFFLEVLGTEGTSHKLRVHSLRIVGNCCADTDENRATVVEKNKLVTIINHLQDESLLSYTIPVLFNTLVDYEPAQLLASQSHLNTKLTALLASPNLHNYEHLIPYFCKILALLVTQDGEPAIANPFTVKILLKEADGRKHDTEDFISLVSVAAAYLANETFQTDLAASPELRLFINAFLESYTWYSVQAADDADTLASLKHLQTSLFSLLADLTGNDAFASHHKLQDTVPQLLIYLLGTDDGVTQIRSAACLALGNLARSDERSLALAQEHNVHQPLIKLLSDPSIGDHQLLHAALSFLKNLAIPPQNKPLVGRVLQPLGIPRLLKIDTLPQVQFAAVSLTRLLLVNCPENARRVSAGRQVTETAIQEDETTVNIILSLFDRSDAEPTKLEAARSIAAICRVLHSSPVFPVLRERDPSDEDATSADGDVSEEDASFKKGERVKADSQEVEAQLPPRAGVALSDDEESNMRDSFYKKYDLSKVLSFLVTQQKWPILRSEAWFVFALMSRSKDGASVIASILSIQEVTDALTQTITGQTVVQDSSEQKQNEAAVSTTSADAAALTGGLGLEPQQVDPKQQANIAKVDRENCLVLCTEIVKNRDSSLPTTQLALLEGLIKQGTELLVAEK
ncbi:Fc.00g043800.m01.CDS01 [Cosmosporella sp. VM-42]